jgi:acyl dehydratase
VASVSSRGAVRPGEGLQFAGTLDLVARVLAFARIRCRFTAPISPGDRATVSATALRPLPGGGQALTFTARKDESAPILDHGSIELVAGRAS